MVQVNISVVMGVLIILTGIALVSLQMMENGGHPIEGNHSFKLIEAEAGATRFNVETTFPGVPMVALGILLVIAGMITSRGS